MIKTEINKKSHIKVFVHFTQFLSTQMCLTIASKLKQNTPKRTKYSQNMTVQMQKKHLPQTNKQRIKTHYSHIKKWGYQQVPSRILLFILICKIMSKENGLQASSHTTSINNYSAEKQFRSQSY